jgi:hypothetical protein
MNAPRPGLISIACIARFRLIIQVPDLQTAYTCILSIAVTPNQDKVLPMWQEKETEKIETLHLAAADLAAHIIPKKACPSGERSVLLSG